MEESKDVKIHPDWYEELLKSSKPIKAEELTPKEAEVVRKRFKVRKK